MGQAGYLESETVGILKRRLRRPEGRHGAETWVWLGSWWLLCSLASEGHRSGTAAAAGGSELARATSRALLRVSPLDSAPDPGQYGRVRSRTAKCVRLQFSQIGKLRSAVTPDANREHPDQGCVAIALVRVLKPTDIVSLIWLKNNSPQRGAFARPHHPHAEPELSVTFPGILRYRSGEVTWAFIEIVPTPMPTLISNKALQPSLHDRKPSKPPFRALRRVQADISTFLIGTTLGGVGFKIRSIWLGPVVI